MAIKLFIGNLPFEVKDDDLKQLFAKAGTCVSAAVVMDRETGRPRGFGFVQMSNDDEARRAIAELNGAELGGRAISVSEARERSAGPRPPSSGPRPSGFSSPASRFGADLPPAGRGFRKDGKSRRGVRGKKRSL
ncbi:MAG TPA: RNA-binding protein [Patescibacteria group bacterium]|nr:RNA-binding protein [Patescibacteria group bacterium]